MTSCSQGYPTCHCMSCCLAYGLSESTAILFSRITDGVLTFSHEDVLPLVLPEEVHELTLSSEEELHVVALQVPEGIRRVVLEGVVLSLLTLPNSLETLHLNRVTLLDFPTLPTGLVELQLDRVMLQREMLSSLPPLPPRLSILRCRCNLKQLPPLPATLTQLMVPSNSLTYLPHPFPAVTHLNLWGNPIQHLPPLREGIVQLVIQMTPPMVASLPDSLLERYLPYDCTGDYRNELNHRLETRQARAITRCYKIKRDLMENRWHPKRIGPLIEAGWDMEDL